MSEKVSRFFFRYAFEFMICGFGGWVYEVATMWVLYRGFYNRGMLHMPVIPIYSVGAFILLAILREKKYNPVFVFAFSAVVTTVFELGSSYLLEFIFHRQFWTYRNWWGSILDRSCVISSAIFGVFAVIYFFAIHPLSGHLSKKLPKSVCLILASAAALAVCVDLGVSVYELLA